MVCSHSGAGSWGPKESSFRVFPKEIASQQRLRRRNLPPVIQSGDLMFGGGICCLGSSSQLTSPAHLLAWLFWNE